MLWGIGEAYRAAGLHQDALASYRKSLELRPDRCSGLGLNVPAEESILKTLVRSFDSGHAPRGAIF